MPKLSKETKRFIGQIFIPGLMFLTVCGISWLHNYTVSTLSPEELAKTVTIAEVEHAMSTVAYMYVFIIGMLFIVTLASAIGKLADAHVTRQEETRAGVIHVAESD